MIWGRTLRRTVAGVVIANAMFSPSSFGIFPTSAHSSAVLAGVSYPFSGATFSPEVAPVISPTMSDDSIALAWPAVGLSSNKPVSYSVTRTSSTGSVAAVCTAPVPGVDASIASCNDSAVLAGVSYTYTQRPVAFVNGVETWSRAASAASATITPPNWRFGRLGTSVVSTNNNALTIPYPSGVAVGDILLLIAVSANRSAPNPPSGWTELISLGTNTPTPFSLMIAWRSADATTSVSFRSGANATGAVATIVNYGRAFSSISNPTIGHDAARSSSVGAAATFTPPSNITTNGTAVRALSVVAVRANNPLQLSTTSGYTARASQGQVVGSGNTAISFAIADTVVEASGSTPAVPTWGQGGTPAQWISGLFAFA